jgi:hypothetical protein
VTVTARVEVQQTVRSADPPRDVCVNTVHFNTEATPGTPDWQALSDNVSNAFFSGSSGFSPPFAHYQNRGGLTKCYDLADAKPRPIKAQTVHTPSTWETAQLAPREVACCLSFYSVRNVKSYRGRIFIGPFLSVDMSERVNTTLMLEILNLGKQLAHIATLGAISWAHAIHSPKLGGTNVATNYWVNDTWDTIRERLPKEATRQKFP